MTSRDLALVRPYPSSRRYCPTTSSPIWPATPLNPYPIRRWTPRCVRRWASSTGACRSEEPVPKLAALLPNDQLSDLARYTLEPIPDPAVDTALREALGKLDGRLLAGVITSIGARHDAAAVEPLSKLLFRSDPAVVSATVAALGNIGTLPAVTALEAAFANGQEKLFPAMYSAILQCADPLRMRGSRPEAIETYNWVRASKASPQLRAAAICGLVLAGEPKALKALAAELHAEDTTILGFVQRDLPGSGVTEVLTTELPKLPSERQVLVVQALSLRGDAAVSALTQAARSGETSVRLAAIRVMAANPAFVPVLNELVGDADPALAMLGSNETERRLAGLELASYRGLRTA